MEIIELWSTCLLQLGWQRKSVTQVMLHCRQLLLAEPPLSSSNLLFIWAGKPTCNAYIFAVISTLSTSVHTKHPPTPKFTFHMGCSASFHIYLQGNEQCSLNISIFSSRQSQACNSCCYQPLRLYSVTIISRVTWKYLSIKRKSLEGGQTWPLARLILGLVCSAP